MKPDDVVRVKPLWNETTPNWRDQFDDEVVVLDVVETRACGSGLLVSVRNRSGVVTQLDSSWFDA